MEKNNDNDDSSPNYSDAIVNVRNKFLIHYRNDPKLFHEKDINLIMENDWWTLRFIKWHRGNEDKALKQMIDAFKWRKSFGINDRDTKDLPIEFAKSAALFPLGTDYKGRNVIYMRIKVYRKIQVLVNFFQQFTAGVIDYVDQKSDRNGFVFMLDASGMGFANLDLEFLQFLIQLVQSYYPYGLRYAICYNVPKILRPMWSIAKVFLGSAEKTIRFCDGKDILEYIPAENLPRYLGGECDIDFTDLEETRQCPSIKEVGPKHGFTEKEIEKYYKIFESNLEEAEKLAKYGIKF
ncbi:motile sperm domain-containing protein 2-like protein [Euroglyphus maynei]|uniref:Motile sperm domain-containing protein 2-like protein n=1 Tax=Euroglyphus maynei TaxID=6958 RepID=A0A1Y3B8S9_EURMA|nr:motile sperm domain-containing protein 2-like protein [Euroglyphus maynei]